MSALMPSFDHARRCLKCGASDIHTAYHREVHFGYACSWGDMAHESKEHMHRTCRRCDYDWAEAPLNIEARQTA